MHRATVVLVGALAASAAAAAAQARTPPKPSISVRAAPSMAFTPARVVVTAELRNVTQDSAEFYCPALEWTWGDGTQSEERPNCDPFVQGTSEVRTRYVKQYTYYTARRYRVTVRLKRGKDTILSGSTEVTVRAGAYGDPQP